MKKTNKTGLEPQGKGSDVEIPETTEADYSQKEKVELLLKIIGRFDFYINSTNTKASIIFAWNGVVIAALLLKHAEILASLGDAQYRCGIGVILVLIGISASISNFLAFRVIFPFLKGSNISAGNRSIFYFGSVGSMSSEQYFERVSKISPSDTLIDITDQGVTLAKGLVVKMVKIRRSIFSLYIQMFLIGLVFLLKVIILRGN